MPVFTASTLRLFFPPDCPGPHGAPRLVYNRRLIRPLRQTRDVALAIAHGDFSIRADAGQVGEIGELAGIMNDLAGQTVGFHRRLDLGTQPTASDSRRNERWFVGDRSQRTITSAIRRFST